MNARDVELPRRSLVLVWFITAFHALAANEPALRG